MITNRWRGAPLLMAALAVAACSEEVVTPDLDHEGRAAMATAPEARLAAIESAVGPIHPQQWERIRMVGDLHAEAMADLRQNMGYWTRGTRNAWERVCLGSFRLTLEYHGRAYDAAGLARPSRLAAIRDVEEAVRLTPGCGDFQAPKLMSLFATIRSPGHTVFRTALPSSPTVLPAHTELEDTLWYGEMVPFAEELVSLWHANPNNVNQQHALAVVNQVLPAAQGIHVGDYEFLLAIADGLISSAADWSSHPGAYDLCDPLDELQQEYCLPEPESLFAPGWMKAFVVVGSDVIGGVCVGIPGAIGGFVAGPGLSLALGVVGATYGFVGGSSAAALALALLE